MRILETELLVFARAVFLDRDGVINESRRDYVKRWEEFRFLPGVLPSLRTLASSPFRVVIVTNQSAVGRGLMSHDVLEDIHRRMLERIVSAGGRVDAIYCCPHRPSDGCSCRKPRPGLFQQAATDLQIDLGRSYCIGDKPSDLQAGFRAGCQGILVLSGEGALSSIDRLGGCPVVRDLEAAVDLILAREAAGVYSPGPGRGGE